MDKNSLYKSMFKRKNNGWLLKNCEMSRGIRQGCPISALLYLFVADILAIKINSNNNIKGISINKNEIKSIQHADDLTIASNDEASIKHALDTIHEFYEFAGSKIEISKTECILLGNLKNMYNELYGIKITNKAVKCLGIYIGHDKEECYAKNWMKIYHNIENIFES